MNGATKKILDEMRDEMTAAKFCHDIETLHAAQAFLRELADRLAEAIASDEKETIAGTYFMAGLMFAIQSGEIFSAMCNGECESHALRGAVEAMLDENCEGCAIRAEFNPKCHWKGLGKNGGPGGACPSPAMKKAIYARALTPRNGDRFAKNADEAIEALKKRFPIEENFKGYEVSARWIYDTQDYCLGVAVDRPFGQSVEGGAK